MDTWIYFADKLGDSYNVFVPLVGSALCFLGGMSMSWSSPVLPKLNRTDDNPLGHAITEEQKDLIGSLFSIGGAIGPIVLIFSLELIGRKLTMAMLAMILSISHFVLAFISNIYVYYACRVAAGIGVSGSFGIVAVYVAEISSVKWRGTFLSLGTSYILAGCLVSYATGPYIPMVYFNLLIAIPAILYSIVFPLTCPESLYYTMQKYGSQSTKNILEKIRKGDSVEELDDIEKSIENSEHGTLMDIFRDKAGRKAFFICTSLLIIQQFSGVNVIITYSQSIFEEANISVAPELCSIIISAFQVGTCFITPLAAKYVDRKILLSISFLGVTFSNVLIGLYFTIENLTEYQWIPLVSLISFVIFITVVLVHFHGLLWGNCTPSK
ncbi:hypothetical protein WA026_000026 [Henosepilachna vigintioctopunctata]|uniref:Major facilitator superfamily (MFS) profile domain-containing protein n=1 Tax=Henosepilachna vigintioctopunctata TaxID=420089 RepID=A0AAW1V6L1_9CUCU